MLLWVNRTHNHLIVFSIFHKYVMTNRFTFHNTNMKFTCCSSVPVLLIALLLVLVKFDILILDDLKTPNLVGITTRKGYVSRTKNEINVSVVVYRICRASLKC